MYILNSIDLPLCPAFHFDKQSLHFDKNTEQKREEKLSKRVFMHLNIFVSQNGNMILIFNFVYIF